jgi:hypothetical protein
MKRSPASLRDYARGFVQFAETHEERGNRGAVEEASTDLDRVLRELEAIDGVRRTDVAICRLSDLGPTPVDERVVEALRQRIAARRENRARRER